MKKIFFIDFDNTIFSHRTNSIPESAMQALLGLQREGHKVILSTGRSVRGNVSGYFQGRFTPDGINGANGAIIEAEGQLLWENYFDREVQKSLFDYLLQKKYCVIIRYEEQWYTSNLERFLARKELASEIPHIFSGERFSTLYDKPLNAIFLLERLEVVRDLEKQFPQLKFLYMGEEMGGADIVPAENSKAKGMQRILDYYGLTTADAVAIGDSMNDLEMLQYAGLGIAIGNAMTEVKAAADYVAKDIDEEGLADAVSYALECFEEKRLTPNTTPHIMVVGGISNVKMG